jgi:hypothetical protein
MEKPTEKAPNALKDIVGLPPGHKTPHGEGKPIKDPKRAAWRSYLRRPEPQGRHAGQSQFRNRRMSPKPEPDARVVDDKVAAAHERAERIEQSAGPASVQSDTEPVAPSVGDLGAPPSADVDHLAAATQKIQAAEEKLKQQSA